MEKITGLKLLPTYSFYRMYVYDSELLKHTDRKSCEISVTINFGSCGTDWDIYMDGTAFNLKPGDAVVYLGVELEHWRKKFYGDYYSQCFLHYVDRDGMNTRFYKDQRLLWSEQKQ